MYKKYFHYVLIFVILSSCEKSPLNFPDSNPIPVNIKDKAFPDFSFAGYEKNQNPIPTIPIKITLSPSHENDRRLIQNAIDSLATLPLQNGFRGALLLKKGEYYIDSTLIIQQSGIVIRGEGQGENGTILHSTNQAESWASPNSMSSATAFKMEDFALFKTEGNKKFILHQNRQKFTNNVLAAHHEIPVENAKAFSNGDTVMITKTTNQNWINKIEMEQYGWTSEEYQLQHQGIIADINFATNTLILEEPLVDNYFLEEGGGTIETITTQGGLNHIGIENLRLIATTDGPTPEHHTWTAIKLEGTNNSWIRNMTAVHFTFSAVFVAQDSNYNTIQDCAMLMPIGETIAPRRYHFYIENGKGNLFQRLYSEEGRHDFVTSKRVIGPNVFLDCLAVNSFNGIGPHHRWASGILFDNISGYHLEAKNRKADGTGHGWAGVQVVYWNSHASELFEVEAPPNAENWCIGCTGSGFSGNGYWASQGQYVTPRSLFIYQLNQRLGKAKTNQIIAPIQRQEKPIWSTLKAWAGSENAIVQFPSSEN